MSVTEQIKERLDIVQYIGEHVPGLKKRGRYYKALCPFHSEDTPSFVVNPETQSWRCFGACAEGGDIFTFAQKHHGWSFPEALRELGDRAGVEVRKRSPQQRQQDEYNDKLRGIVETAAEYYHEYLLGDDPYAQRALYYAMKERGFSMETIKEFQIGYAPDEWRYMLDALQQLGYKEEDIVAAGVAKHNEDKDSTYDRFRNRLVVPILDDRGRPVGFGGRILDPEDFPKYLNSPQNAIFDKSRLLYGLDKGKRAIRETETAVIVEGYMDVIQAHQAGYRNVVAQMGTAMTEDQLSLIAPRYASKVIMALDADEAGQNATRRSLDVARQALEQDYMGKMDVDIRVLQMKGAKDPDDVLRETPDKWDEYIARAKPVAEFVIDLETANLDSQTSLQEKQRIAQNILPILMASESNLYRRDNLQKLAMRLRISEQDLLMWAQEFQRREQARQSRQAKRSQQQQQQQQSTSQERPPRQSASSSEPDADDPYADAPPPDYESQATSSEPPPPVDDDHYADYDGYTGDDDDADIDTSQAAAGTAQRNETRAPKLPQRHVQSRHSSREAEEMVLWFMLHNPDWMSSVKRFLRETIGNTDIIISDLQELKQDDFTQSDYRVILELIIEGLSQDDEDLIPFIQSRLDPALEDVFENITCSPEHYIQRRIGQRFRADADDILDNFFRRLKTGGPNLQDLIAISLMVKRYRIMREQQEIQFLLRSGDPAELESRAMNAYIEEAKELQHALASIDERIKDNQALSANARQPS